MTHLWFEAALLPEGWADGVRLTVAGGLIGDIAVGVAPEAGDARHSIGLPGLANAHSHAFQRAMAGLTEHRDAGETDFWSWRTLMYRFVDTLTPDDVRVIATWAYVEMLQRGFTRVGEFHYLHHDPAGRPYADQAEMAAQIAAAAEASGIGLTLLPTYYAQGGFGGVPANAEQRRFLNKPDGFGALMAASASALKGLPDAVLGVAPHSLRAVSPDDLALIVAMAPEGPVHIHAAEQVAEVIACVAWSGRRPVAWLLDEADIDGRWNLVHATHMTPSETRRLAASGATAVLCPITEANLGDGVFPAEAYLAAGGAIAIGSDSNVLIDPAEELRLLEYGQRLTARKRNRLAAPGGGSTGRRLFDAALAGGARALGRPGAALRVGDAADIVSLDPAAASLAARGGDRLLDGWIFAGGSAVDCVWRRGRQVVSGGRHVAAEAAAADYRRVLGRLLDA